MLEVDECAPSELQTTSLIVIRVKLQFCKLLSGNDVIRLENRVLNVWESKTTWGAVFKAKEEVEERRSFCFGLQAYSYSDGCHSFASVNFSGCVEIL